MHSFSIKVAQQVGIEEAILYQNLKHWVEKNAANGQNFFEGRYWTYNTTKAFSKLFPYMTEKTIYNSLRNLIKKGLVIKGNFNSNKWDRTAWYSIIDFPKLENGDSKIGTSTNSKIGKCINTNINTDIKTTDIKNTNAHASDALAAPAKASGLECEPNQPKPKSPKQAEPTDEQLAAFEIFWEKYPKRNKRQPALVAFLKALSGKAARGRFMPKGVAVTPELIMQGLEQWIAQWKREGKEKGSPYIPDASTWLNDMCYLDSLESHKPDHLRRGAPDYDYGYNGFSGGSLRDFINKKGHNND